jgi:intracellular sulfur oxidation DsrE/DsrF family protein
MSRQSALLPERRSFLTRLNTGLASLAAMAGVAMAQEEPAAGSRWQPARHDQDDWLDQLAGKHRVVFDTTTPEAFGEAIFFANNFMNMNRSAYGLQNSDLAVVIVARHNSTAFGYNDAMWAKYGLRLASLAKAEDPRTKQPPKTNLYNATGLGALMPNHGTTWDSLFQQGVHLAVCSFATRAYSGAIAQTVGSNVDAIFSELTSNLVSNARMVPAGIVAVNRAQERGYSLVSA